ncbi:MAG: methylated-DNA--[protein]-cysteine S-methyltransferase [Alphaproteobacteria bacterium]|nr:methylated-DNA--[protein]-cysteine S-methyltransferase [Alphaproteobacteria bacterium]
MQLFVERIKTPIGPLLITHDGKALANIAFADREERRAGELARDFPGAEVKRARERSRFADALESYFEGNTRTIDKLPVINFGTDFQRRCWSELRRVPAGSTRTYSEHARIIGRPNASRAVGAANGFNPVSIVVPCHRLIGANGSLIHYGGGIERKRWLIDHEAQCALGKAAT